MPVEVAEEAAQDPDLAGEGRRGRPSLGALDRPGQAGVGVLLGRHPPEGIVDPVEAQGRLAALGVDSMAGRAEVPDVVAEARPWPGPGPQRAPGQDEGVIGDVRRAQRPGRLGGLGGQADWLGGHVRAPIPPIRGGSLRRGLSASAMALASVMRSGGKAGRIWVRIRSRVPPCSCAQASALMASRWPSMWSRNARMAGSFLLVMIAFGQSRQLQNGTGHGFPGAAKGEAVKSRQADSHRSSSPASSGPACAASSPATSGACCGSRASSCSSAGDRTLSWSASLRPSARPSAMAPSWTWRSAGMSA